MTIAAELTLPRTAAWVWYGEPRSIFGLDAVFVRCASGTSGAARSGFSYADNFRDWLRARGPAVIPWSWFGPPHSTDGLAFSEAHQLIDHNDGPASPGRPAVVCDNPASRPKAWR